MNDRLFSLRLILIQHLWFNLLSFFTFDSLHRIRLLLRDCFFHHGMKLRFIAIAFHFSCIDFGVGFFLSSICMNLSNAIRINWGLIFHIVFHFNEQMHWIFLHELTKKMNVVQIDDIHIQTYNKWKWNTIWNELLIKLMITWGEIKEWKTEPKWIIVIEHHMVCHWNSMMVAAKFHGRFAIYRKCFVFEIHLITLWYDDKLWNYGINTGGGRFSAQKPNATGDSPNLVGWCRVRESTEEKTKTGQKTIWIHNSRSILHKTTKRILIKSIDPKVTSNCSINILEWRKLAHQQNEKFSLEIRFASSLIHSLHVIVCVLPLVCAIFSLLIRCDCVMHAHCSLVISTNCWHNK